MLPKRFRSLGLAGLAIGYGLFYVPYAGLVKALAGGDLTGTAVSGFELLPATALGAMAGMLLFLGISGMWRHARQGRLLGITLPYPGKETFASAAFSAVIILTTTLNFTFAGVSILFMLLLMRGGVLILSPVIDTLRQRNVQRWSWVAVGLSLAAITITLADVEHYDLSAVAAWSLTAYLLGYCGRFHLMARHAKSEDARANRRYFVEEHLLATPLQVGLLALPALAGQGEAMLALRRGFSSFLASEAAVPAFVAGLLYEGLFVFGSLIYLDRREYAYCVPLNRGASLLAGVVASYGLTLLAGAAPPSASQMAGGGLVLLALLALAVPAPRPLEGPRRLLLFVCAGNTCRSPMAEAIARAELARRLGGHPLVRVLSAGLAVRPRAPMTREAELALRELGVPAGRHRARPLEPEMVERAAAVFCMTEALRQQVLRQVPGAAGKTWCLDPQGDIPDPIGSTLAVYGVCARRIRASLLRRFDELGVGV